MQKLILWMKLGTKSDLSWATFGHEHHDEATRDAQAPAQASSEQPAYYYYYPFVIAPTRKRTPHVHTTVDTRP